MAHIKNNYQTNLTSGWRLLSRIQSVRWVRGELLESRDVVITPRGAHDRGDGSHERSKSSTDSVSLGSHTLRPRGYPHGEPRYDRYVTCTMRGLTEARLEAGTPLPRKLHLQDEV